MQQPTNPQAPVELLAAAIQQRLMVRAVYNSITLELAPHQIFQRNDALYLSAVNPARKRRVDEAPALGHFKIDGLSELSVTDNPFVPLPAHECALPREGDRLVFDAE